MNMAIAIAWHPCMHGISSQLLVLAIMARDVEPRSLETAIVRDPCMGYLVRVFGDCSLDLCLHCVQCRHRLGDMRSGPSRKIYIYTVYTCSYIYIYMHVHNILHLSMSRCIHI